MTLYIVRHAVAVPRRDWSGDDDDRPLTKHGSAQADILSNWSRRLGVEYISSSPTLRCVDTVLGIAQSFDLPVTPLEELRLNRENDAIELAARLLRATTDVIVCSHGEIIKPVLRGLRPRKTNASLSECAKGSVWALEETGTGTHARYVLNEDL
jgi:phosphohistidine phosphatase SixA